jgi:hypothetical protein
LRGQGVDAGHGPKVLGRHEYGWAEYILHDLRSEDPATYYQLGGSLLAVLHALGARDAHAENVIVAGNSPVLIDAETVLQPTVGQGKRRQSILDSLLLSQSRVGGPAYSNISALAAPGSTWWVLGARWKYPGSDAARYVTRPREKRVFTHVRHL